MLKMCQSKYLGAIVTYPNSIKEENKGEIEFWQCLVPLEKYKSPGSDLIQAGSKNITVCDPQTR
jgi:hypothetical protein